MLSIAPQFWPLIYVRASTEAIRQINAIGSNKLKRIDYILLQTLVLQGVQTYSELRDQILIDTHNTRTIHDCLKYLVANHYINKTTENIPFGARSFYEITLVGREALTNYLQTTGDIAKKRAFEGYK